jgi:hypothetical protein
MSASSRSILAVGLQHEPERMTGIDLLVHGLRRLEHRRGLVFEHQPPPTLLDAAHRGGGAQRLQSLRQQRLPVVWRHAIERGHHVGERVGFYRRRPADASAERAAEIVQRFPAAGPLALAALPAAPALFAAQKPRKKLAVVTTIYHLYSHADHIAGRFLYGYIVGGKHHVPDYEVVSMHVAQTGERDLSAGLAKQFGFRQCKGIREALTLGGDKLAVDAVLLIGEHGNYPENELGQKLYPRYEMMKEIVDEFRASGRSVPVFNDKHLSYSWTRAKQMVDWSRELRFPLQAGSSLPVTFRMPDLELPLEAKITSALAAAYSHPEIYGFHLLETLQCHVERRTGGETGVKAVQAFTGDAVWQAGEKGIWSEELLRAALGRSHSLNIGEIRENVKQPLAYSIEYRDGFKASALMLNGHVEDFTFAAKIPGVSEPVSTMHYLPSRPGVKYFDALTWNIERMLAAGTAVVPIERTLLVSGTLEALLQSKAQSSKRIETPHLDVAYKAFADSGYFKGPVDPKGQADAKSPGASG